MKSRGRRPTTILTCPAPSCGQPLASTDGRRLYLGVPRPSATSTERVSLCCTRPNCGGHVTWHPGAARAADPEEKA